LEERNNGSENGYLSMKRERGRVRYVWSVHSLSPSDNDCKSGGVASEIESCKVGCRPVGDKKVLLNVEAEEW